MTLHEKTHLEKAKGALVMARANEKNKQIVADCLDRAQVQAAVASAEALTRIADVLEEETKLGGALQALTYLPNIFGTLMTYIERESLS